MPSKVAPVLRAYYVAGSLALCIAAAAAERKSPLIGATKDEVLARFGEPKSQIVAGPREVLFFAKERIVLRDNRVVEVEILQSDAPAPSSKAASKPAAATPAPESAAAEPATDGGQSAPTRQTAQEPGADKSSEPASTAVAPPPEPEVLIKSVRPPSRSASQVAAAPTPPPAATAVPAPAPVASLPVAPASEPVPAHPATTATESGPVAAPVQPTSASPAGVAPASPTTGASDAASPKATPSTAPEASTASTVPSEPAPAVAPPAKPAGQTAAVEPAAPAAPAATSPAVHEGPAPAGAKPAAAKSVPAASIHRETVAPETADSGFSTRNKLIALAVILLGGGYLVWRRRQRTILLEATAVSRSPFVAETPVASSTGSKFTPELLQKLEWCRFEELVAAYYNKTGVVASRTKSGPDSAVHIRISWKGEQRPFACVQCVANPAELVGPNQVQALCDVLAAEDIRRGYIVTSGKFSVPARDLAEEKHVTLLPGDIFLEKLNALPEPVRAELLRDATSGDYTTPTCPKCEIKTVRADGSTWKCVQCGTELSRG